MADFSLNISYIYLFIAGFEILREVSMKCTVFGVKAE
jgi:hypothetical protein